LRVSMTARHQLLLEVGFKDPTIRWTVSESNGTAIIN
jgi:hypothetical protein